MSLGRSDRSLTRTAWWSVPVTTGTLEAYLLAHRPAGLTRTEEVGGGPLGIRDVEYDEPPADPSAHLSVALLVQWLQVGDHTLIRADTFTAARAVRPASTYIDATVNAVDIDRVVSGQGRHGRLLPPVRLTALPDAAAIDELVAAFNALPASIEDAGAPSCPFPGRPAPSLTLTFRTAAGTIEASLQTSCFGQVEITRNVVPVRPTLDPSDLAQVVDHLRAG